MAMSSVQNVPKNRRNSQLFWTRTQSMPGMAPLTCPAYARRAVDHDGRPQLVAGPGGRHPGHQLGLLLPDTLHIGNV